MYTVMRANNGFYTFDKQKTRYDRAKVYAREISKDLCCRVRVTNHTDQVLIEYNIGEVVQEWMCLICRKCPCECVSD